MAAANPRWSAAWAALGDLARDDVEAYAAYRVGYHRGLDSLRANGWRGSGFVRWEQPANRGFLRALAGLARQAATIGESDEGRALRAVPPPVRSGMATGRAEHEVVAPSSGSPGPVHPPSPTGATRDPGAPPVFSGAVLAGGASRRMGRDKALVEADPGRPLGRVAADALWDAGAVTVTAVGGDRAAWSRRVWPGCPTLTPAPDPSGGSSPPSSPLPLIWSWCWPVTCPR